MSEKDDPKVAILDLGAGNLYSITHACRHSGLDGFITADPKDLTAIEAIILPGVGAFPNAIKTLKNSGLSEILLEHVSEGMPLMGICLGYQLLMTESDEFGTHKGLNLIEGVVRSLRQSQFGPSVKVPNVGWSPVRSLSARQNGSDEPRIWDSSLLEGVGEDSQFYFAHSYFTDVGDAQARLAFSSFHGLEYCCCIQKENIFGCQFHPERSGENGLRLYRNLRKAILDRRR